jgi:hypothetical protein
MASTAASTTPVSAPRQPACADDARCRIGEQHWAAIGGRNSDRQRPHPGDDGVGPRPRLAAPGRFGDHDVGRMNLVGGKKAVRRHADRRRHAGPVFRHLRGIIAGANAAIEAGIEAAGDAALAGEKAVADAGERQQVGFDLHG